MKLGRKTLVIGRILVSSLLAFLIVFNSLFVNSRTLLAANQRLTVTGYYMQDLARQQISYINAGRTDPNCRILDANNQWVTIGAREELTYDYTLEQIAMQRALDIITYFEHQRPDGTAFNSINIDGVYADNENIHWSSQFTEGTVVSDTYEAFYEENEAYVNQGHRRTMFNENYTAVGIAAFVFNGELFWVQEFSCEVHNPNPTPVPSRDTISANITVNPSTVPLTYGIHGGDRVRCNFGYQFKFSEHPVTVGYFRAYTATNPTEASVEWIPDDPSAFIISSDGISVVKFGTNYITANLYVNGSLNSTRRYQFTVDQAVHMGNVTNEGVSGTMLSQQQYTGQEIRPSLNLTYRGYTLVEGVDYSVSYSNNINVTGSNGYATVTATGIGPAFTGSKTWQFRIVGDGSSSGGDNDQPTVPDREPVLNLTVDDCRLQLIDTDSNNTYDEVIVYAGVGTVGNVAEHISTYASEVTILVIYQDTTSFVPEIAMGLPNLSTVFLGCTIDPSLGRNLITDHRISIGVSHQTPIGCSENCPVCNAFVRASNSHTWVSASAVAATCTTPGREAGRQCSSCGKVDCVVIPALGHSEVVDEAVAATCTTTGLTVGSHCSRCNEVIVAQEVVEATGHSIQNVPGVEATCTTDGSTAGSYCTVCNTHFDNVETIPATGHTGAIVIQARSATCEEDGCTVGISCTTCGAVIVASEVIPALGHDEVVDEAVPATCTELGLSEGLHCSRCEEVIVAQNVIDPLGHSVVVDRSVPATCGESGLTAGSHCSRCEAVIVAQETIEPLGHDEIVVVDEVAPSCTSVGHTIGTECARCGETIIESEEIAMLEHSEVVVTEEVPATCTTDGTTAEIICTNCHQTISEATVIPALGHNEVIDEAVPATCCDSGLTAGSYCSRCEAVIVAQEEVAPLGHYVVVDEVVPATCTTTGLTAGSHCSRCNEVIVAQETTEALGHNEVVVIEALDPTCTVAGHTEGTECSRCHETITPSNPIPTVSHVESPISGYPATCTTDGLTDGVYCTVCRRVIQSRRIIPAGHTVVVDEAVAATCTETGLTAGTHCSVCETVITAQQTINALGHDEVVDEAVAPTCLEDGLTAGSHCSRCNEVIVAQEVDEATGHTVVVDEAVPATCTTTGLTIGHHCSVCEAVLVAQQTTEALGHDEVIDEAVPATCTSTGLTAGTHCARCEEVLVAQETVAVAPHTPVVVIPAVDPTCRIEGNTVGTECSECGITLEESVVIPVIPHTEGVLQGYPATCTVDGLTNGVRCTTCGRVIQARHIIPAGHEVVVDEAVPATCISAGLTEGSHCSRCEEVIVPQEEIPVSEEHVVVVDRAVPATWNETGLTEGSHCSVCGEVFVAQEIVPIESGIRGFVTRLYACALDRDVVGGSGVDYWSGRLEEGMSGADLAHQFFFSKEVLEQDISNEDFVSRLYRTFFGREAQGAGRDYWLGRLNSGATREEVFNGFVNSQEWANLCYVTRIESGSTVAPNVDRPAAQNVISFVQRLYTTCLGREVASGGGVTYWGNELENGRRNGVTAAREFFFSSEFVNQGLSDEEFVQRLYMTCMNRNIVITSNNYWVGLLKSGVSRERVFESFINSNEFRELCASWGIQHS